MGSKGEEVNFFLWSAHMALLIIITKPQFTLIENYDEAEIKWRRSMRSLCWTAYYYKRHNIQ